MAKTIKEERLRWVVPIWKKELKLSEVAKVCPYSKRSLERWLSVYKNHGAWALEPKSTEPKRYRIETPIRIKERVIEIRKKTKKCALKIHWQLEKEGILIHQRTVGKILKKERLVRKYRSARIKYKYIKVKRKPGELLEIDVKYVPGRIANKRYYQYTVIDTASRWRHMEVYEEQTNHHSVLFLEEVYEINTFKNFSDLQRKLKRWNMYYNNLEHCGLDGKTPNEFLADYSKLSPPNVCT